MIEHVLLFKLLNFLLYNKLLIILLLILHIFHLLLIIILSTLKIKNICSAIIFLFDLLIWKLLHNIYLMCLLFRYY